MRGVLLAVAFVWGLVAIPAASPAEVAKQKPLCLGERATIVGTAGADTIFGTRRADVIATLGGADDVEAAGGNDLVCTGAADDVVQGGAGRDRVDGGAGFDACRTAEKRAGCETTLQGFPSVAGNLRAGSYITDVLRPRVSLELGAGWLLGRGTENRYHLDLQRPEVTPGVYAEGIWFDSFRRGSRCRHASPRSGPSPTSVPAP